MNTAAQQSGPTPYPMDTAPKDGTIVRLLVRFTDGAFDDVEPGVATWTIGQNGADHHPEDDEWLFSGWNWEQDCFTQGEGEPIGWLPLHGDIIPARQLQAAGGKESLHPAQKALRRIRSIADMPGTVTQHGVGYRDGMRRAANTLEEAINKAPPAGGFVVDGSAARMFAYVTGMATRHGWIEADGEGALEFLFRKHYATGRDDALAIAQTSEDAPGVLVCAEHGIHFHKGCAVCEQDIDELTAHPSAKDGVRVGDLHTALTNALWTYEESVIKYVNPKDKATLREQAKLIREHIAHLDANQQPIAGVVSDEVWEAFYALDNVTFGPDMKSAKDVLRAALQSVWPGEKGDDLDGKRYRWLREPRDASPGTDLRSAWYEGPEALDAAIDAAIEAERVATQPPAGAAQGDEL